MKTLGFSGLFCLLTFVSISQEIEQKLPDKTRILFLLDGSGSMLASWGKYSRIEVAKELLTDLIDSLKIDPKLQLGLRVYGHIYSRQAQNCKDTRLEVGFATNNHQRIIDELTSITPKGTTPIAYSLEQAANDFPLATGYRNIVIIITDGIESCDGDPCSVSLSLQRKNIFLKPFIIGIGMTTDYRNEFKCIGEFYDAKDQGSFQQALQKAIVTSLEPTSVSIELLDDRDLPTESNINVSFINNFTKVPVFDFVHYRDSQGRPDSVDIDPVLTYDIIANTLPPVIKRNVRIRPGEHNVIKFNTPRGTLQLSQKGSSSYPNGVRVIIKDLKGKVINVQPMNSSEQYIAGEFQIETLTLPRKFFKVVVKPRQTEKVTLPAPGIVNIYNISNGYGSMYEINSEGRQTWIYDLDHNQSRIALAVQPGNYKIVFRVDGAPGSKYTSTKRITVKEGLSQVVRMF
ncbi:MAG: VWA domain-containing protein [Bacteroidota bacterium]